MNKRFLCIILSVLLALGSGHVFAENTQTPQDSARARLTQMEAELEIDELPLSDRFIVKLKPDAAVLYSGRTLDAAIDNALPAAKSAADEQVRRVFAEKKLPMTSAYSVSRAVDYDTEELPGHLLSVTLSEKVDTEVFVSAFEDTAQVEYVRPDCVLELSSEAVLNLDLSEPEPAVTAAPAADDTPETAIEITPEQPASEQASEPLATPIVAVIDSGIDITHEGLTEQMLPGYDFVNNTELVYDFSKKDEYTHGTHVAGVIAKNAPDAHILPLRVFEHGRAYTSDIIRAIEYAEQHGANIVNMSFGGTDDNRALKEAMASSGVLFVCAAGNHRLDTENIPIYPACFDLDNIISVASLNQDLGFSYYSNYGTESVDIAAIGRDVNSTWPEGEFGEMSGTSQAAAQVSAGAAIAQARGLDAKSAVLSRADRLSHLENKVTDGKSLNIENIINDIVSEEAQTVEYEDDFDVHGYQPTPEESWELFSSTKTVDVAVSFGASYALKSDGSVWAWGSNEYGMLGESPEITYRPYPARVPGLIDVVQISAKMNCICALTKGGDVIAWGRNNYNALGPNVGGYALPFVLETGAKYAAAGYEFSVVVKKDGKVTLRGNEIYLPSAEAQSSITGIKKAEAGWRHVLLLKDDGRVMSWGYSDGSIFELHDNTPFIFPGVNNIVKIKADAGLCVLFRSDNTYITVNNPYYESSMKIRAYNEIIRDADVSSEQIFFIAEDGTVTASGNNMYSQLGISKEVTSYDLSPRIIPTLTEANLVKVYTSPANAIGMSADGSIWTWGDNSKGQLGHGDTDERFLPERMSEIYTPPVQTTISAGTGHSLVIDENGDVLAAGRNSHGQLGNGTQTDTATPEFVKDAAGEENLHNVVSVQVGLQHSVALKNDGTVWCWGNNGVGQLGCNNNRMRSALPVRAVGEDGTGALTDVIAIAAGQQFSMALTVDGQVFAWGDNTNGLLGVGSSETQIRRPMPVLQADGTPLAGVISIAAGLYRGMALKSDGTVWCWGKNENGQLGNGQTENISHAVQVLGLNDVSQITAGEFHSMVLKKDGTVWTWGMNRYGQLGDNTRNSSLVPVQVRGVNGFGYLTGVIEIVAGNNFSMALLSDGRVMSWGHNNSYQLGDGTQQSRSAPVYVQNANGTGVLENAEEI